MHMPTLVKVRKWGNSLGLRLPKSFTAQRDIVDGSTIELDSIKIVSAKPRRRSSYKLKDILRNYTKVPKELDFPRVGKELL
jgi:antitoxin component of MazEF toxin-antitoxin module